MIEMIIVSIILGIVLGLVLHLYGKRTKNEAIDNAILHAELERARADNPLIKELHENQAKRERTRLEMDNCRRLGESCLDIVTRHRDEIPHEDYAFFMLHEGWSTFLPISIKPFLGQFEGMMIATGMMYFHNPLADAKIKYVK